MPQPSLDKSGVTEEPPGRCFPARCGTDGFGYCAAWAAWGAPSRCPRTVRTGNSAIRVFTKHETRDPRPGYCQARGVSQREFRGFHETRNTRHESRLFFESRLFCRVGRQVMREGGQARRIRGGMYEARENEWKGVYLNPETGITTYTESGFGSRFGIPHYSSVFVGKIRISPCRQSSASEHCGNRDIGFMDASRPRVTFPGPQVSPSGKVKGERATNRETQPLTRREEQAGPNSEVFTKHETRITKHGLFFRTRNTAFETRAFKESNLKPFSLFFLSGDGLG